MGQTLVKKEKTKQKEYSETRKQKRLNNRKRVRSFTGIITAKFSNGMIPPLGSACPSIDSQLS